MALMMKREKLDLIEIGPDIKIEVLEVSKSGKVTLSIDAPLELPIEYVGKVEVKQKGKSDAST